MPSVSFGSVFVNVCDAVHMTGMCNGRIFDERDVTFIMGCGSEAGIVPGVEIALKKFRRGEKSRLKVAANYGYGSEGCSAYNIAPGEELSFEVEMRQFFRVIFSSFTILNSTQQSCPPSIAVKDQMQRFLFV